MLILYARHSWQKVTLLHGYSSAWQIARSLYCLLSTEIWSYSRGNIKPEFHNPRTFVMYNDGVACLNSS